MALRWTIRTRALAACVAAGSLSGVAVAQDVRVTGNDCAATIRVEARDARLSYVLKRVAQTLDFQLSFEADADPLVTIDASRDPLDMLASVSAAQNVSIAKARNPRCPERERIVKVWVLPKGQKVAGATPLPQPPSPTADEQARAQEGINMVLQAHGIPPQSEEEEQEGGNPH